MKTLVIDQVTTNDFFFKITENGRQTKYDIIKRVTTDRSEDVFVFLIWFHIKESSCSCTYLILEIKVWGEDNYN